MLRTHAGSRSSSALARRSRVLVWVTLRRIAAFVVGVRELARRCSSRARCPRACTTSVASYVRYATQVSAYVFLAADPYPWFRGQCGLSRRPRDRPAGSIRVGGSGFFRLVSPLPALAARGSARRRLRGELVRVRSSWTRVERERATRSGGTSPPSAASPAAAFARVVRDPRAGAAPRGLRDLTAFALRLRGAGGRVPLPAHAALPDVRIQPRRARTRDLPEHPVRIVVADDLERPRLTVFFRLFLAIPPLRVDRALVDRRSSSRLVAAWVAALVTGRVPDSLHRFLAAYVRYATHLVAFVYLIGAPLPRLHRDAPARTGSTSRSIRPATQQPLDDAVPVLPLRSRVHPRERPRRRRLRRSPSSPGGTRS